MKEYTYHAVLIRKNERVAITDYHDTKAEAIDEAIKLVRKNEATSVLLHVSRIEKYRVVHNDFDGPSLRLYV